MKWIDAEKEQPSDTRDVLAYVGLPKTPSGTFVIANFIDNEWIVPRALCSSNNVTHWVYLPEGPVEEEV